MALFEQIKALLGLDSGETGTESERRDAGDTEHVAVTVEHEPETEHEDAVKGTGSDATDGSLGDESSTDEGRDDDEGTTTDADADDTAESVKADSDGPDWSAEADGEESEWSSKAGSADEEASAATPGTADASDTTTETAAASEPAASPNTEDVQSIKGIGPAYAERLAEADVETVGDLASTDADAVAETTGIATSRVEDWIERARE